eukprot:gnl/TRDRNA2_/TRDRNA2_178876_c0_seq1.p1 gnl/TRDRNA2_/TRDRNA2_178876_c0~~gnl/TRDRNA2_/TRDRNA2_178876_c0_seq1.p1  ORF type:complete len:1098 (-),score=255.53 gnl/TRDRNA2_/TRDRNA2_178876_c0_seq1:57-3350(-)
MATSATTSMTPSSFSSDEILMGAVSLLWSARVEILLFVVAMAAYFVLFGNVMPRGNARQSSKHGLNSKKVKKSKGSSDEEEEIEVPQEYGEIEQALVREFEHGDHRNVLRCWGALKKFDKAPSVPLAYVVESMQRFKKDISFILKELKAFYKKYPSACTMSSVNDLLESLGKRLDTELMEKVVAMLPSIDLAPDRRTYELFLTTYFTTRNFQDVRATLAEMKSKKIELTTRGLIVVIKTELKLNNYEEALKCFRELKELWTQQGEACATASAAPRHIVAQLVDLACKEHQLGEFLSELHGVPVSEEVVAAMLNECIRQKDCGLAVQVEKLTRQQKDFAISEATYALLLKAFSGNVAKMEEIVEEVLRKDITLSSDLGLAALSFCQSTSNIAMADRLYANVKQMQLPLLSAFIRFYSETEQFDKACDAYEREQLQKGESPQEQPGRSVFLDARMERSLMNAALRCGRSALAKQLLSSSPSDVAKHITMIRNCAAENNLQGAMRVFESLKSSGVELNSIVYNTVLDACVECRDLHAAEKWMVETRKAGMTDVVSFNTLIKAHLHENNFTKARALMEDMKSEGLQPNRVTFNELINSTVTRRGTRSIADIWDIIQEMQAAGVPPNQVTCSILLKSLNNNSSDAETRRVMEYINTMEEPMDEVLLSSVVEACVRVGKPDLLSAKLKELQGSGTNISGSHTFGSLIKAYSHAKDIDGVWRCWKEMRSRHIKPTSITLGCMIEAVVSNGDPEGAWELIHQMQDDHQCQGALNSVIYCSVLKGFCREKKLERCWAVYEEMTKRNIDFSIVTYNTLIDACARCGRMEQVSLVIDNMKRNRIWPNVITYSTMLKGHCQAGDIQTAFSILEQMKKDTNLKPDEIMYNSLLDGCAQANLVEEGLRLFEEMQQQGVVPSNFTLSILVKLMNRSRKLDQAFVLVKDVAQKFRFTPNNHVYNNLMQACISNKNLPRALSTFETMLHERVRPDNRTYAVLIRGCLQGSQCAEAADLVRKAFQLPGSNQPLAAVNLESALVSEALVGLADRGHAEDLAVPLLSDIKQHKPQVRIESSTTRRLMASACGGESPPSYTGGKGGKGKGSSRSHRNF